MKDKLYSIGNNLILPVLTIVVLYYSLNFLASRFAAGLYSDVLLDMSDHELYLIFYSCLLLVVSFVVLYLFRRDIRVYNKSITISEGAIEIFSIFVLFWLFMVIGQLIFGTATIFEIPSSYSYYIYLVFVAPVYEEIMFRGFLYEQVSKVLQKFYAIFIASGVFVLFHYQYLTAIGMSIVLILFLYALLLMLAYLRVGLLGSILLHSSINAYLLLLNAGRVGPS